MDVDEGWQGGGGWWLCWCLLIMWIINVDMDLSDNTSHEQKGGRVRSVTEKYFI